MQRSSRVGLFVSATMFFSSGTMYFWPDGGFVSPPPDYAPPRPLGMPLMIPEAMASRGGTGMLRGPLHFGGAPFAPAPGEFSPSERAMMGLMRFPAPRLRVDYANVPTKQALKSLFTRASLPYAIEPGVQGRVSLQMDGAPVGHILEEMQRRAEPPFTFRLEQGRYVIRPVSSNLPPRRAQQASGALVTVDTATILGDRRPHLKSARQ